MDINHMEDSQLIKRIKSLLWRAGVVATIAMINFIVENVAGLGVPGYAVVLVGLVGGEITKYLNTKK
jgi:hypothetical protein